MRNAASDGTAAQFGMPFQRANPSPITLSSSQPIQSVVRKPLDVFVIALILASVLFTSPFLATPLRAQEPPPNLIKLVAHRETETEKERAEYMYRQGVTIDEMDDHGATRGQYRETRDVIFSPQHDRTEEMIGTPSRALKNLILTDEDFQDIRNIQPLVLTEDRRAALDRLATSAGVPPEQLAEDPRTWVGSVPEIVESLERHRRRFGISHWVVYEQYRRDAAPIVAELAGR